MEPDDPNRIENLRHARGRGHVITLCIGIASLLFAILFPTVGKSVVFIFFAGVFMVPCSVALILLEKWRLRNALASGENKQRANANWFRDYKNGLKLRLLLAAVIAAFLYLGMDVSVNRRAADIRRNIAEHKPKELYEKADQCRWAGFYGNPVMHGWTAVKEGMYKSKSLAEALHWCREAADQGDKKSQEGLIEIYSKGILGVNQDYAEALFWSKIAQNTDPSFKPDESIESHLSSEQKAAAEKRVEDWTATHRH